MQDVEGAPGGAVGAPSLIRLESYDFAFVAPLMPERETTGFIREFSPQWQYAKANSVALHKYGQGAFCKFRISVPRGQVGVYALIVNGDVRYIGECEDLGKRFNMGYGNISPKNCYVGGQPTNCKINRHVLDVSKVGARVDLFFHSTLQRKPIEAQLIAACSPPWNG